MIPLKDMEPVMRGCFFNLKPPAEIDFLLRVLDCSDLMELADMYGEARDHFKSLSLCEAVNERMSKISKRHDQIMDDGKD